jgi:hypothetical protein
MQVKTLAVGSRRLRSTQRCAADPGSIFMAVLVLEVDEMGMAMRECVTDCPLYGGRAKVLPRLIG